MLAGAKRLSVGFCEASGGCLNGLGARLVWQAWAGMGSGHNAFRHRSFLRRLKHKPGQGQGVGWNR